MRFNPAIRCLGDDYRYGDQLEGDSSKNYVSAIMTKKMPIRSYWK